MQRREERKEKKRKLETKDSLPIALRVNSHK
jgi:hypothetical protein